MIKIVGSRSNWEIVAFYFIEPLITEKRRRFTRSSLMKDVTEIYPLLTILGHKKNPTSPEQTLQKTLQNMRDKKWITFLRGGYTGEYELTDDGFRKLLDVKDTLDKIRKLQKEGQRTPNERR